MRQLRAWFVRLDGLLNKQQRDRDLDDELQTHLDMQVADNLRRGMSSKDARRNALIKLGCPESAKELYRDQRGVPILETAWRDTRHGVRILSKSPGFAAIALLTISLGIGANTAIFTLINAVVLKSLPVERPDELVLISDDPGEGWMSGSPPGHWWELTYPSYQFFRDHNDVFQDLSAVESGRFSISARSGDSDRVAVRALGQLVSGNYFSVLGVKPRLGRLLTPDDDSLTAQPVAVISYGCWERRFGRQASAVGSTVVLNNTPVTIIGVTRAEFFGERVTVPPDYWLPISLQPRTMLRKSFLDAPDYYWLNMIGRLKHGVTLEQAQAALNVQLQQFASTEIPDRFFVDKQGDIERQYLTLVPGARGISGLRSRYSDILTILMGLVVLVLSIACLNIANLLLSRAGAREKEVAIRLALGASRARLVRQLLTESLLLAVMGGAMGLLLARWSVRLLASLVISRQFPLDLEIDRLVLGFTLGACLVTGLLFGLAPALRATGLDLVRGIKGLSRSGGRSRLGLGRGLVAVQVAMSLLLVVSAGTFARSLKRLLDQDLGFNRENVLLVDFDPRLAGYKPDQLASLYQQLLDRVGPLRGVHAVTVAEYGPLGGGVNTSNVTIAGFTPEPRQSMDVSHLLVGPQYLETLGIPLLAGREISAADNEASTRVAVINETAARNFFPDQDPIGKDIYMGGDIRSDARLEIVGVAGDIRFESTGQKPQNMLFASALQKFPESDGIGYLGELEIRTDHDPLSVAAGVREVISQVDPLLPVTRTITLSEQISQSVSQARALAAIAACLGVLALLLATVGTYGLMSYSVACRRREIGIRIALGAQRQRIMAEATREALVLVCAGICAGVPAAVAAAPLIKSQVYSIGLADPLTIVMAAVVMAVAAGLASYLPARRASRVDPVESLRYE